MPTMSLLYDILMDLFGQQRGAWKDKRHLKTFIWMTIGLIQEMNVALPRWVPYVHSRATQSASTVRRFSRWLRNPRIEPMAIWKVYGKAIWAYVGEGRLYVALDTTSLWGEFCWVRISLVYRGRALPLAWKVLRHKSTRVAFAVYEEIIRTAAEMIGREREVVLLADRGFCDLALFRLLDELGWHWRIRIKNTFLVYKPGKGWRQVAASLRPPARPFSGIGCISAMRSLDPFTWRWDGLSIKESFGMWSVMSRRMNRPLRRMLCGQTWKS